MRKIIGKFVFWLLSKRRVGIQYYDTQEFRDLFDMIKQIKNEVSYVETYTTAITVYHLASAVKNVNGHMATLGVYRGGSAKIVCLAKDSNRTLHLFDTFEGQPALQCKNDLYKGKVPFYAKNGVFKGDYGEVKKYLSEFPNVHLYKGLFSKTSESVTNFKFAFVHIDFNLYESTKDGIEFFYLRMNKGGIMLMDDYFNCIGVKKAIDEFFKDKPETPILITTHQVMVVIMEGR